MSADEHADAAEQAEADANAHEAQYDPEATTSEPACAEYCFWSNPTSDHLEAAQKLRRIAAKHREASNELRVAEERACQGIPEENRDISPFFWPGRIASADIPDEGAIVVRFDTVPGVNTEGFEHLVECHLARYAAMGYEHEGMDFCPLAVRGVEVEVAAARGGGTEVRFEAEDPKVRAQIEDRVTRLELTDERNE